MSSPTYGELVIRILPNDTEVVRHLKLLAAEAINVLNDTPKIDPRLKVLAINSLEVSCLLAVKAATPL